MDRREALEKAFEEAEAASEQEAEGTPEETTPPEGEKPTEGEEGGEPVKGEKEEGGEKSEGEAGKPPAKQPELEQVAQLTAKKPVDDGPKAPQAWKPAIREHWGKLPKEVRDEVSRRELEVQQVLNQSTQARRFAQEFGQVIQPFQHLIAAQNSTPLQAVRNVMTTAAGLMTGTPEQKARIIAETISNYGVDVRVLDAILSNGQIPQNAQQPAIPPQFQQMLQPVYGFMNEIQQARQQREGQMKQQADAEVANFAEKPFFDDVREDMADLMEIAAKNGREMTMLQAYERAVSMNPEIQNILTQRRQAEEAKKNGGTRLAQRKKAASTISGSPAGPGDGKTVAKSRREQLEQAWDDAASP